MKISDLQDKTIINITDGKNLGNIIDLDITADGNILNFYAMPKHTFFKLFSSKEETVFKIENIKKIGEDVILVEIK